MAQRDDIEHFDDVDYVIENEYEDERPDRVKELAGQGATGITRLVEIAALVALLFLDVLIGGAVLSKILSDIHNPWYDVGIPFGLELASSGIQIALWRKLRTQSIREQMKNWVFWLAVVITLIDTRIDSDVITLFFYGEANTRQYLFTAPPAALHPLNQAWLLLTIFVALIMLGNEPILMYMVDRDARRRH